MDHFHRLPKPDPMRGRMVVGSPESDAAIDGVIVNLPSYVRGSIIAVAEALRPVVGR